MSEFLLQDSRSNVGDRLMFWQQGGGYTSDLDKAERFTLEQATSQNQSRETDLPWPLAYLMERHELAVDCQYVKPDAVELGMADAQEAYLYVRGDWNGNDLLFASGGMERSADLRQAERYPLSLARLATAVGMVPIPIELANSLARMVAPGPKMNHKRALKGTGIVLAKPPRRMRSTCRCDHCGVFISERQQYDACPKCGGSNAP